MRTRIINPSCSDIYKLLINGGYMTNLDKDGEPFVINEHNRRVYLMLNNSNKTLVMGALFFGDDSFESEKECLHEDLSGDPTNPELSLVGPNMGMHFSLSFVDHLNIREFYKALFYFCSKYNELLSDEDVKTCFPYAKRPDRDDADKSPTLN